MTQSISPDTKLGRYTIISKIGSGGMGQVYKAKDNSELDRVVAIKLLPTDVAADPKWMRRFIREARTVSALNHPNVLTVYEFGQVAATRFIAMEYVDGVTLREHLRAKRLDLHVVLDIAMQVATALNAAHEAHVVHRDIKPDNIMVRRDGIVKILDFGLAKPINSSKGDADSGSDSYAMQHTEPGTLLGTVSYMSPEQSAGLQTLDYRTDIWSLGAVLYEMVTGRVPFQGKDVVEQITAIQEETQPPLASFVDHIPDRLEEIVRKALAKSPDQRYQTANDFLTDLRNLKRKLELEADHDHSALLDRRMATTWGSSGKTSSESIATTEQSAAHPVSSAEYIVNQVKVHRGVVFAVIGVLLLAIAGSAFWYFKHARPSPLSDKDTILLTEFENKTGEEVFDRTLKQGLTVQLQQSPFLDIFPDQRVRVTLQLMSLSPDERVTRDRAQEICQRQGLKAYIAGEIVKFDRNYSITLEALNGQTGDQLALVQVEAEGKDQVLKALSQAASQLREKLGESLSSIQKFDAKLEVTTSSLEALKEYAVARAEQDRGQFVKALEGYRRATDLDPNFAVAWLGLGLQYNNTDQPGLAAECLAKAYSLRDRVSENEQARIVYFYYQIVTGELDKAIEVQEAYVRNYPREARGPGNLGNLYEINGEFEKAVTATREALRLNPNTSIWPGNLAESLIRLNRFSEAAEVCQRALEQKLDSTSIRERLYAIAFVNGDVQSTQSQRSWANGRPDEYRAGSWQIQTSSFAGKWKESQEYLRRASELAIAAKAKEAAAVYTAEQAVRAALIGESSLALELAESALKTERNRTVLTNAGLAFALIGESGKAQSMTEELEQRHPKNTLVNQLSLPEIEAAIELRKGNAQAAIEILTAVGALEPAGEFFPQTLRCLAYLKLGKGPESAAEANKVISHRGESPLSLLWPYAHLQLARAMALQGDAVQSKKAYEVFFALWKEADADLPLLVEAKNEYAKLK